MLKPREELIDELERVMLSMAVDVKQQNEIIKYCHDKYEVREDVVSDYLRGQKKLMGITPHLLFILADAVSQFVSRKGNLLNRYYTPAEIETGNAKIYDNKKLKFPLRFKMYPVAEDSWIGPITVQELNRMYEQQLINYNENTQRALKMSFYKGQEVYRIFVNKAAVKSIREAFHEGKYIPNTITLNLPMDNDAEFFYNTDNCELVIKSMKMFDILDGYHRLLAIAGEIAENSEFQYPMELRITNYDDDKAKQFIYQEDQKTRMKKAESNTYNVFSPENKVCMKLNTDPRSDVQGMIGVNNAKIDQSQLIQIMTPLWFKNITKTEAKAKVFPVTHGLTTVFNALIETDPSYLNKRWSYKELLAICYFANRMIESGSTVVNGEQILECIDKIKDDPDPRLKESRGYIKATRSYLDKVMER